MAEDKAIEALVTQLSHKVAGAAEAMNHDEFASLLDDDYMSVDFDGKTHNKEERVAEWKAQKFKASSVVVRSQKVRTFGDTAIATGVASVKANYNGKDISGEYAFTQVFRDKAGARLSAATKTGSLVMTHSTGTRLA
jgi:ketosteroid isomerase-like protein